MTGPLRPPSRSAMRRVAPKRDMDASPFASILGDLVARVPGALGAVLVDKEGESVDYAGHVDPYELRVAGAYWQIVLSTLAPLRVCYADQVILRAATRSYIVRRLPDGYALVIWLSRRAGFSRITRALAACAGALAKEAAWDVPRAHWAAVRVQTDARERPSELIVGDKLHTAEVLGTLTGLRAREKGYRVRLDTGAELNLVREASGHWYAES